MHNIQAYSGTHSGFSADRVHSMIRTYAVMKNIPNHWQDLSYLSSIYSDIDVKSLRNLPLWSTERFNTPVLINIFPLSARNFSKDTKNNFKDYWWANIILRALLRCIESFCSLRRCCIQAGESVGTRFHACSLAPHVCKSAPLQLYTALYGYRAV